MKNGEKNKKGPDIMVPKTVYLSPDEWNEVKEVHKKERISMAALIRIWVRKGLKDYANRKDKDDNILG